jgi:peptide deformylase
MAILELYTFPHKVLSQKCERVEKVDDEVRKFLDDMLETMYHDKGVGLAAPQVGVLKRIIVIDDKVTEEGVPGPHPMYMVNPEIIEKSNEKILFNEGCLSVPGQCAEVERYQRIKVKYLDYNGKEQVIEAEDYLAVILQHEIDHLDGILYIDRISRLKRQMLLKKLQKLRDEKQKNG